MHPNPPRGTHLRLDGISKSYPDRRVLTDISFAVAAGERAALIGENGTGKSTLLRIVAGLEDADVGTVSAPGEVGLFHQQPPFSLDLTADEVLQDAAVPLRALVDEVTQAGEHLAAHPDDPGASARLELALAEAERRGVWELDHTIDELVEGLGIADIPRERPARDVSGGQLARFSLAWMLVRRPETLLLDEPTNHLDDRGAELLARMLHTWPGPVLMASHDRAFLDESVSHLLDLDPRPMPHRQVDRVADASDAGSAHGLTRFTGTYSQYVVARADELTRWQEQYEREQDELNRLRGRLHDDHRVGHPERGPRTEARGAKKFYSDRNATVVARRVNDARTALERLEDEQVRKPPKHLRFNADRSLAAARRLGELPNGALVTASNVTLRDRLRPTSLALAAGERLLVEGPNGCGKSTLLEALAGRIAPDDGSVTVAPRVSVALLGQDAEVSGDDSVRDTYEQLVGAELAARRPLATFGLIAGRDELRPVNSLSVGQRRRLDLALLLALPPDVLLLDEPTNHFSLLLSEDIERALGDYPGAVVVASHDRMLRRRWAGQRLELHPPG
ncbi:ATP-binding cassette domain-containing protein [Dermacoccus abyssi]|uniref:ABC-F family ATP-binding cassette domain-containing protein n=1 Tax=Dermacoccus abyssi TaxID=322596 RepID=UPI0021A545AC|nr:ATP-binding cassette domain-containing protein [Dermacoccus abyssi]MCT1987219.1 ATP-binding cassette domain-containing protein [Dermacoccus abyssi]